MAGYAGRNIGRYEVLLQIAEGSMATVYRAYDPERDQAVAIKVLSPVLSNQPKFRARFEREAGLMHSLRHPNIVPLLDYGHHRHSLYLVMPFIGPYTLRELLGRSFYGYMHPVSYMVREHNAYYLIAIDLVTLRAEFLPFDAQVQAANDPYVLIRDVYLQNREFKIYDGEPPAPDYDALLEDY